MAVVKPAGYNINNIDQTGERGHRPKTANAVDHPIRKGNRGHRPKTTNAMESQMPFKEVRSKGGFQILRSSCMDQKIRKVRVSRVRDQRR